MGAQAYTAILKRIRLLIPAELDGHYEAIRRGFEEADLTAPSLAISDMQLVRAISEFTGYPPNEASIATLQRDIGRDTIDPACREGIPSNRAGEHSLRLVSGRKRWRPLERAYHTHGMKGAKLWEKRVLVSLIMAG
jgi:hypothetical protein